MASVIRTKDTAPEKKPADRSNAARPGGSREEKVPKALSLSYFRSTSEICRSSDCFAFFGENSISRMLM
jgi:hypothetical protein